jgi:hypothetical protein
MGVVDTHWNRRDHMTHRTRVLLVVGVLAVAVAALTANAVGKSVSMQAPVYAAECGVFESGSDVARLLNAKWAQGYELVGAVTSDQSCLLFKRRA